VARRGRLLGVAARMGRHLNKNGHRSLVPYHTCSNYHIIDTDLVVAQRSPCYSGTTNISTYGDGRQYNPRPKTNSLLLYPLA
jgi:hypothetical protein